MKNSRSVKSIDPSLDEKKDSGMFWNEVLKRMPENAKGLTFFSKGKVDQVTGSILSSRGLKEVAALSETTNIVFSDNLKRDIASLNEIKGKKNLIVVKDTQALKDVMSSLGHFEVLLYQVAEGAHYFLLQPK